MSRTFDKKIFIPKTSKICMTRVSLDSLDPSPLLLFPVDSAVHLHGSAQLAVHTTHKYGAGDQEGLLCDSVVMWDILL
jgi:hypothetical protein